VWQKGGVEGESGVREAWAVEQDQELDRAFDRHFFRSKAAPKRGGALSRPADNSLHPLLPQKAHDEGQNGEDDQDVDGDTDDFKYQPAEDPNDQEDCGDNVWHTWISRSAAVSAVRVGTAQPIEAISAGSLGCGLALAIRGLRF
jgi:hypothetical protein